MKRLLFLYFVKLKHQINNIPRHSALKMSTELIYTDGACSANGTSRAAGGFGVFIARSSLSSKELKINCKGKTMVANLANQEHTFLVTNIRMEGLAIVSTLALYANVLIDDIPTGHEVDVIKRLQECEPFKTDGFKTIYGPEELKAETAPRTDAVIEIVTDSLFWMNVIQSWMPGWIRKNIMMEKKNPDILLMMLYYTERLKQNGIKVVYTHVKSHQKKGKRTEHADGNDVADVLATSSVNNITTDFYQQ